MRPAENMEKLIKNVKIDTNVNIDKAVLDDVLEAFEESQKRKSAFVKPTVWRTIIKSKVTKLAAAAVVIIVALIGIDYFGGSVDPASVAWGKMIENMKQLPWMHIIMESERDSGKQRFEAWISFELQVCASKRSSGEVGYADGRKHVEYRYDPGEKVIKISYLCEDITRGSASVLNFWETWLKQVTEFSTESTTETGRYNGRKTRIYKFKASKNEMSYESMITVDISRNLPVFGHQKSFDSNGNLIKAKDLYFEYPEEGPASIYDVGAPRNVRIIDNLPK